MGKVKELDQPLTPPLSPQEGMCGFNPRMIVATCSEYEKLFPRGEEYVLQRAVAAVGPIAAAVVGTLKSFLLYQSGNPHKTTTKPNPQCWFSKHDFILCHFWAVPVGLFLLKLFFKKKRKTTKRRFCSSSNDALFLQSIH